MGTLPQVFFLRKSTRNEGSLQDFFWELGAWDKKNPRAFGARFIDHSLFEMTTRVFFWGNSQKNKNFAKTKRFFEDFLLMRSKNFATKNIAFEKINHFCEVFDFRKTTKRWKLFRFVKKVHITSPNRAGSYSTQSRTPGQAPAPACARGLPAGTPPPPPRDGPACWGGGRAGPRK